MRIAAGIIMMVFGAFVPVSWLLVLIPSDTKSWVPGIPGSVIMSGRRAGVTVTDGATAIRFAVPGPAVSLLRT